MELRTEIERHGYFRCGCGASQKADLQSGISVQCEDCDGYIRTRRTINEWDLFSVLGIRFELDWDGSLIVVHEKQLSEELRQWIFENQRGIADRIRQKIRVAQSTLQGGPFDGQRRSGGNMRGLEAYRVSRAKWAVYRETDGKPQAFFIGYAKSKKKALKGVLCESYRDRNCGHTK